MDSVTSANNTGITPIHSNLHSDGAISTRTAFSQGSCYQTRNPRTQSLYDITIGPLQPRMRLQPQNTDSSSANPEPKLNRLAHAVTNLFAKREKAPSSGSSTGTTSQPDATPSSQPSDASMTLDTSGNSLTKEGFDTDSAANGSPLDMLDPTLLASIGRAETHAAKDFERQLRERHMNNVTQLVRKFAEIVPHSLPLATIHTTFGGSVKNASCSSVGEVPSADSALLQLHDTYDLGARPIYLSNLNCHNLGPHTDHLLNWRASDLHKQSASTSSSSTTTPSDISHAYADHFSETANMVRQTFDPATQPSGILYAPGFIRQPQVYAALLRSVPNQSPTSHVAKQQAPQNSSTEPMSGAASRPVAEEKADSPWNLATQLLRASEIELTLYHDAQLFREEATEKRRRRQEWQPTHLSDKRVKVAETQQQSERNQVPVTTENRSQSEVASYDPFTLIPNAIMSALRLLMPGQSKSSQDKGMTDESPMSDSILRPPEPFPDNKSTRPGLSRIHEHVIADELVPQAQGRSDASANMARNEERPSQLVSDWEAEESTSSGFSSGDWGRILYSIKPAASSGEPQRHRGKASSVSSETPLWRRIRRVAILGTHGWKPFIGITSDSSGLPIATQLCDMALGGLRISLLNSLLLDASEAARKAYEARRRFALPNEAPDELLAQIDRQCASADELLSLVPTPESILQVLGIEVRLIPIAGYGRVRPRVQNALEMLLRRPSEDDATSAAKAATSTIGSDGSASERVNNTAKSLKGQPPSESDIERNFASPKISHADALTRADLVLANAHSQGCVVMSHILTALIEKKILSPQAQRICLTAMAGIHHGPFQDLPTDLLSTTKELFLYGKLDRAQFQHHLRYVAQLLSQGVRVLAVGAWADAVVPLYSSTLQCFGPHPNLLRALIVEASDMAPKSAPNPQSGSATLSAYPHHNQSPQPTQQQQQLHQSSLTQTSATSPDRHPVQPTSNIPLAGHNSLNESATLDQTVIHSGMDESLSTATAISIDRSSRTPVDNSAILAEDDEEPPYDRALLPMPKQNMLGSQTALARLLSLIRLKPQQMCNVVCKQVLLSRYARSLPFPFPLIMAALRLSSELWTVEGSTPLLATAQDLFKRQSVHASEFLMLASTLARHGLLSSTHSNAKQYLSVYILASEWALAGETQAMQQGVLSNTKAVNPPPGGSALASFPGALSWLSNTDDSQPFQFPPDVHVNVRIFAAMGLSSCAPAQLSLAVGRTLEDLDNRSRLRRALGVDPMYRRPSRANLISMHGPYVSTSVAALLSRATQNLQLIQGFTTHRANLWKSEPEDEDRSTGSDSVVESGAQSLGPEPHEVVGEMRVFGANGIRVLKSYDDMDHRYDQDFIPHRTEMPLYNWLLARAALELENLIDIAGPNLPPEHQTLLFDTPESRAYARQLIVNLANKMYRFILRQGAYELPAFADLERYTASLSAIRLDSLDNADMHRLRVEFSRDFDKPIPLYLNQQQTPSSNAVGSDLPHTAAFGEELRDATETALRHLATESLRGYKSRRMNPNASTSQL